MLWRIIRPILVFLIIGIFLPLVIVPYLASFFKIQALMKPFDFGIGFVYDRFLKIAIVKFTTPQTYLFFGLMVSSLFLALYSAFSFRVKEYELLKKQIIDMVSLVASYVKTGVSILNALEYSVRHLKKPLSEYIESYASLVRIGEDPYQALDRVFEKAPREVRVIMASIAVAMTSGGRVSEVLGEAERYVVQLNRMYELRDSRLSEYKVIIILAVVAFIAAGAVSVLLINSMGASMSDIARGQYIDIDFVITMYYLSSMLFAMVSSIVVARTVTDSIVYSYRYIGLLIMATTFIFVAIKIMTIGL